MAERLATMLANRYYDREGTSRIHGRLPERRIVRILPTMAEQAHKIEAGRKRFAEIADKYPHAVLDRTQVERDLDFVQPSIFARPKNAVKPNHEARHIDAVYLLGEMLAGTVEDMQAGKPDDQRIAVDRQALKMATRTHDVARFFPRLFFLEPIESLHGINQLHGQMAAEVLPRWFSQADATSMETARRAVRNHDRQQTPKEAKDPTLELLVIADRLELTRIANHKFWGRRIFKQIFINRENKYQTTFFPGLREMYKPVAEALFIATIQRLNDVVEEAKKTGQHVTFDDQRKALLDSAETLGIIKSKVPSASL